MSVIAVFAFSLAGVVGTVLCCIFCCTLFCGRFLETFLPSSSRKPRIYDGRTPCSSQQFPVIVPSTQQHPPPDSTYYLRTEVTPLVASAPPLHDYTSSAPSAPPLHSKGEPPVAVGATTVTYEVTHQQPLTTETATIPHVPIPEGNHWRDMTTLLLFILNLAGLVTIALWYGLPYLGVAKSKMTHYQYKFSHNNLDPQSARNLLYLCLGLMGLADVLALLWMHVMLLYAGGLLQVILWTTVVVSGCLSVVSLLWTNLAFFTYTFIAIMALYILYFEKIRLRHASANLRLACASLRPHQMPLLFVTYLLFTLQILHTALWCLAAIGAFGKITSDTDHTGHNTILVLFLILSLYWGSQVIQSILTCTVSGAVGSWWYTPHAPRPVPAALYRACTWSLGSICLGSLCVAFIGASRWAFSMFARAKKLACCLACVVDLLLAWAEECWRQFNRWAYVYVSVFGYDFRGASTMALRLFHAKHMDYLIDDYLISNVLVLSCILVGAVTASLGVIIRDAYAGSFQALSAPQAFLTIAGFLLGYLCCSMVMGLVSSAVDTVIVCYVNDPSALQFNHPAEFQGVSDAWREAEAARRGVDMQIYV